MKLISINDLHRIKNKLKGFKIIFNQNGIVKFSNDKEIISYQLDDYFTRVPKLLMPNYNNSILNIDASISKYFNVTSNYNTNKIVDDLLKTKNEE